MSNFAVSPVPGHRIVKITVTGAILLEDVPKLAIAQANLVKALGYADETFDALIDGSIAPIQSLAVADALYALARRPDFMPYRYALVHGDRPVKMQMRRLNIQERAAFFVTEQEALEWLKTQAREGSVETAVVLRSSDPEIIDAE